MKEASRIAQSIGQLLSRFVCDHPHQFKYPCDALSRILQDIALAAKVISREVNKAGLIDIIGPSGYRNTTGDNQQKLDALAHIRFSCSLSKGGKVCALISEETKTYEDLHGEGEYVVAIDPLDGSSNIDVNAPIGTIFSVYRRVTPVSTPIQKEDLLRKGSDQVAAGYVLYGTSTLLVYTSGHGVNGFTYDRALGEFLLSHPNIIIPKEGSIYSINEGQYNSFQEPLKAYIKHCKEKHYTARYIGALVADFHRNLLKGGIYIYPRTQKNPKGKLRLLYECNALAFIVEQAGGKASDGQQRILDIVSENLHQRTPFYIGSQYMMEQAESCLQEGESFS